MMNSKSSAIKIIISSSSSGVCSLSSWCIWAGEVKSIEVDLITIVEGYAYSHKHQTVENLVTRAEIVKSARFAVLFWNFAYVDNHADQVRD